MSEKPPNFSNENTEAQKRITKSGVVKLSPDFEYILSQTGFSQESAATIRSAADPFSALSQALKQQIQFYFYF